MAKYNPWPSPRTRGLLGGSGSREMVQQMVTDGELSENEAEEILGVRLWPTPRSADGMTHNLRDPEAINSNPRGAASRLKDKVSLSLWATPSSRDWRSGKASEEPHQRNESFPSPKARDYRSGMPERVEQRTGTGLSVDLNDVVALYPTPNAHEPRLGYQRRDTGKKGAQQSLTTRVIDDEGGRDEVSGQLNPDWVEWLMNWPLGWTSLDPLPPERMAEWLLSGASWWYTEPPIPRVASGVPNRVSRLKAIGNGQVPACASLAYLLLTNRFCLPKPIHTKKKKRPKKVAKEQLSLF